MPKREVVFYEGEYFTIVWGATANAQCQALEYFEGMNVGDQAKASALFVRLADQGAIYDKTKFRKETDSRSNPKRIGFSVFCEREKGSHRDSIQEARRESSKARDRVSRGRAPRLLATAQGGGKPWREVKP